MQTLVPCPGSVIFNGWAVDRTYVYSGNLIIDGSEAFSPQLYFGGYRADVCAVHNYGPDCPQVGWSALVETSTLANGMHTVALQVGSYAPDNFNFGNTVTTAPVTFLVQNPTAGSGTHIYIDEPTGPGQIYWGTASFSGWAIDNDTNIASIRGAVDGLASGQAASYGPRPDVCAAYPNRPGCPNVGWTFNLDTTRLSNGVHTFTATAITAVGLQISMSRTFTVNNANGTDGTKVFIDTPNSGSGTQSGQITTSGWAIGQSRAISDVILAVDGERRTVTTPSIERRDVCDVYPNAPNCPVVGWTVPIDTTYLSNGVHQLSVTASTHQVNQLPYDFYPAEVATATTFITVGNSLTDGPVRMYIDTPNANSAPVAGAVNFAGWAIDRDAPISSVQLTVDGGTVFPAGYGVSRPDVCAAWPSYNGCPAANIGWAALVDTTVLANGPHTLNVTATSDDGAHQTISAPFTVSN